MKIIGVAFTASIAILFAAMSAVILTVDAHPYWLLVLLSVVYAGGCASHIFTAWEIATGRRVFRYSKDGE